VKPSDTARRQVNGLRRHYRRKQRPEALRNLSAALRAAPGSIAEGKSLAAPRPYPGLAAENEAWVYAAPYWIACSLAWPPVILAVFFDQTNSGRFQAGLLGLERRWRLGPSKPDRSCGGLRCNLLQVNYYITRLTVSTSGRFARGHRSAAGSRCRHQRRQQAQAGRQQRSSPHSRTPLGPPAVE